MCSPGARRWRSKECEGLGPRAEPSSPPCAHPSVDDGPGRRATGGRRSISVPLLVGRGRVITGRGVKEGLLRHPLIPPLPTHGPGYGARWSAGTTRPNTGKPAGEGPAMAGSMCHSFTWMIDTQSHCTECCRELGLHLNFLSENKA
ncbi:unnamed protein product [Pleuronectes platessa]|uniref:Uncharacterized protein n=1 Tax=Pleuronectes platessa TaxID=8262 RepID=A0A9N7YHZ6_PLEPL|nr:unnamed protein product [Pleuronectes platessa]